MKKCVDLSSYLGKTVEITIDRPLGSAHPQYPQTIYPLNYGYLPDTLSGDGEEIDVYLMGVPEPVLEYTARVIAVIHRENDVEDKLVAVPEGMRFTRAQIEEYTAFQERYFQTTIEMENEMHDFQLKIPQTDTEIKGMGGVMYHSWQETYKGLMDEEYLKTVTPEKCEKIAAFQKNDSLVAKIGEEVAGFVTCGACRDENAADTGEIYAIYLLAAHQGKKVGYRLMNAAMERLDGYDKVALWVLAGNEKAIRFYERYGFRLDGKEKTVMIGSPCTELRMVYKKKGKR
ncbi:MAG: GNAT family N-acetyltransferase [Clostridia bacterium]|nr:GNAT family N-acetyltransferase [Clostridia bacterium]